MPSKDRDRDLDREFVEVEERPKVKRKSSKSERKGDGEKEKDKDRHRHRSSRSSKPRPTESDLYSSTSRRHRYKDDVERERDRDRVRSASISDLVPELARSSERVNIPYPSFSKAHSKETVSSKVDVASSVNPRTDPLTPEATDLGDSEIKRSKSADFPKTRKVSTSRSKPRSDERPPSPPETNLSGQKTSKRAGTPSSSRSKEKERDIIEEERPRSRTSFLSRSTSTSKHDDQSGVSSAKSKTSTSTATYRKPSGLKAPYAETVDSTTSASTAPKRTGSGATARPEPIDVDFSPESVQDSSPHTPTQTPQFPPPHVFPDGKYVPPQAVDVPTPSQTPMTDFGAPPPPPPPPPPLLQNLEAPRVDYLMQNGGLPNPIPRHFLAVLPRQNGTRPSNPPLQGPQTLFAPFFNLLGQYQTVLSGSGSIAVATGHRTVARRLLDRLENVFSRDLPPDGCSCVMCDGSEELHRGLGWGEVLERVGGRVGLPAWPPFDLAGLGHKAAETADIPARPASPVKMDPDIGEEFREHYLRQSKKVRHSVDKWMAACAEAPAPPPQEVDDETLTFAIMTSLAQEDRPYFNALLTGSAEIQPTLRAPTPMLRKPRQDFIVKTGLALQRLYRLATAPRDAEAIVYLVKNPHTHDLLHTISDINPQEWEILTSGRFDGFLWSGADDDIPAPTAETPFRGPTPASGFFPGPPRVGTMSPAMHRNFTPGGGLAPQSRTTTPFSRGATPASFMSTTSLSNATAGPRHAVSNDEETEIAALAEIEREIFAGMEALEDAFETLHRQAEQVRTALRQRGAGLAMSLQQRRGGVGGMPGFDVLPNSGNSQGAGNGGLPGWWQAVGEEGDELASESEWGGEDVDLAPEDSASNISSSRRRRPQRRTERRTPAPIEEEEEG